MPASAPTAEDIHSFTKQTLNLDDHPFKGNFHRPADEKRMVVKRPESSYDDWLKVKPQESMDFVRQYPAE